VALASISAVRTSLASAAAGISGLRSRAFIADAIEPPTFVVGEVEQDFDLTMGRGVDVVTVQCRLYTSRASERGGQDALDVYLAGSGARSIKRALEVDKTLGGACQDLRVSGQRGYGVYNVGGLEYIGAEFSIQVWG
jgi:hypothetical protein